LGRTGFTPVEAGPGLANNNLGSGPKVLRGRGLAVRPRRQ